MHIAHTPTVDAAKAFIADIQAKYNDANHNCWAYVAGDPQSPHVLGFSDDGEPSGTAGKPMLNVLRGSGFGEICAVVTRYFGGIKLGTGGLVRAYGGSLNDAIAGISTLIKVPSQVLEGESDYGLQGAIEQRLKSRYSVIELECDYGANIRWHITLDARQVEQVIEDIRNLSQGAVELKIKQ